ncbi:hypothetical protein BDQ17DRAFT_1400671 [Cyathus striatus]|nr:hypothetical protein BDQ17DRAFT_1400671 [Cyathus striatus]
MDMEAPSDLIGYKLNGSDSIYVPNFITIEEEEYLIRKITESPRQRWKILSNRRLQLWGGELTNKGVLVVDLLPPFVRIYPDIISRLRATGIFKSSPHGEPNHIIMNEYLPGQGIMPHEDGPRYHPVVATISLGSHCVFNYYRYKGYDLDSGEEGRSIDTEPALSILLEPRSLVISSGTMYTEHLHGIDEREEDFIEANRGEDAHVPNVSDSAGVFIANMHLLNAETRSAIEKGVPLHRQARYSLTCRDVERVSNAKSILRI